MVVEVLVPLLVPALGIGRFSDGVLDPERRKLVDVPASSQDSTSLGPWRSDLL